MKRNKTFIEKDINHWPILMTRFTNVLKFSDFNLHLIVLFTPFSVRIHFIFLSNNQSLGDAHKHNGLFIKCVAKTDVITYLR